MTEVSCPACGKVYKNATKFKQHVIEYHGMNPDKGGEMADNKEVLEQLKLLSQKLDKTEAPDSKQLDTVLEQLKLLSAKLDLKRNITEHVTPTKELIHSWESCPECRKAWDELKAEMKHIDFDHLANCPECASRLGQFTSSHKSPEPNKEQVESKPEQRGHLLDFLWSK